MGLGYKGILILIVVFIAYLIISRWDKKVNQGGRLFPPTNIMSRLSDHIK